jgi:hypothetical protein
MNPTHLAPGAILSTLAALTLSVTPVSALDFTLVDSFDLNWMTPSAPRSYSVSPAQGTALVAFADGSIFEVNAVGARQVIAARHPADPPTDAIGQLGYYGIALVPPLNLFVSLINATGNGFDFYTLSGQLVALITIHTGPRYNGVFFEERDEVGDLHAVFRSSIVEVWTVDKFFSLRALIFLPLELRERARGIREGAPTGIVYLSEADLHLLSLGSGHIIPVGRGRRYYPDRPEIPYWIADVLGEVDLTSQGVQRIEDITWDPLNQRLYVVDSVQRRIFVFALPPVPQFHRGDPDETGTVGLGDAVAILDHLFSGTAEIRCLESADANNSGNVDVSDPIFLLHYLFFGGEAPPAPGPPGLPCGPEPSPRDVLVGLGCESYAACEGGN